MNAPQNVLIVLHGDRVDAQELPEWAKGADVIIAADGGAEHILHAGLTPNIVVGDLDGISEQALSQIPPSHIVASEDQNTTDCQKALRFAEEHYDPRRIVVFGLEGTRYDHFLSAIGAAAEIDRDVRLPFLFGIAYIVKAGTIFRAAVPVGVRCSLLPLVATQVIRTEGLKWNAGGLDLALGVRDGISNVAVEPEVLIEVESGCLGVFIERYEGDIRW